MTTVVVVGSGIAGLTAALHAHENGCRVTVVTKGALADTNTRWAQGGIAAVTHPADTVASHAADTTTAGAGLNDDAAVETLVAAGPTRIAELVARGVAFDRSADGDFARGLEAAHAVPRVLHAGGDATGAAIQAALGDAVRAAGIPVREHALLADLVVVDGRVGGIRLADGERLDADAVILATGGAGQLYAHTTNPLGATGDGIAAAIRAGAAVADLEFVQFHPTALAVGAPFLVSEAVRGEGATLIDDAGRRFALDAHPDGELAPRDVVARANARAMAAQGGRPVRLDATTLGAARLAERFPTIDAAVRERGLDWAREPIPVTPAAHYLMGGVVTDLDGRTTLPGLYAVGETARTGVHGANRLASNSLLEGAVFGARAGEAVARDRDWPVMPSATRIPAVTAATDAPPFSRAALQRLMWDAAGLVRDADGLAHAAGVLAAWIDGVGVGSSGVAPKVGAAKPGPDAVAPESRAAASKARGVTSEPGAANIATRAVEDANLLLVAAHVVAAARARTGSVGAHFRSDAPDVAAQGATASLASAAPASDATGLRTSAAPGLPASAAPAAPASIPAPQEALAC